MTDQTIKSGRSTLGLLQDRRPVADIVSEYDDQRRARYHLQRVIADIMTDDSTGERLLWCGRRPVPRKKALLVYQRETDRLYTKNLMTCGLGWFCPVCSARITGKRRRELSGVIGNWSGSVIMGAFTVGHHAGDKLADAKKVLDGACRSVFSGRVGQDIKHRTGIVGTIQANEVTWSPDNGWHPHRHVLFFTDHLLTKDELSLFTDHVSSRFASLVTKNNGYTVQDHAVHISLGKSVQDVSKYCFKWGIADELFAFQSKKSKTKTSYTPFELADLYGGTGDQKYRMLFREYVQVFKGLRRASYSRGLKGLLGIAEKTDQMLLAETEAVQIVPAELLPDGASVVQVIADITTRAVKVISVADRWDNVMDLFKRSIHQELTFMQLGVALASIGLRVAGYNNGVMGIYSLDEPPPSPSPEMLFRAEKVQVSIIPDDQQ